jgi:hypothetical protein
MRTTRSLGQIFIRNQTRTVSMPDKMCPQPSEIIVKVPVGPAKDRERIAADIVALLHRAGIAAEVILPDAILDPSDDETS